MSSQGRDIFSNLLFAVDFAASSLPFNRKQELRKNIVENGGTISYLLTKKVPTIMFNRLCKNMNGNYQHWQCVAFSAIRTGTCALMSCVFEATLIFERNFRFKVNSVGR